MKELDYYNFLEEADCLMKKYKEEQKELTEEVFLNFLKEMIKKYNITKRYECFRNKNDFLFITKNKQCYTIITFEKDEDKKIIFSGYSLQTKKEGQEYFEENFNEYEKVDFL
ncbi:hypothetical protein J7D62_001585 [Campylobacter lari]|uniref:hypothetical protein n=1 Tax=Campylobacter lari TaxID=201 RepID=UPI0012CA820B|nr:hypothetical protein [Campylobacter lari]EAK9878176.1 hypothetical protein [Campylobacter lari]ECP5271618.1 hypothetical protein [Campylobacter lari]EHH0538462.1 hypothetical protein [Campylobacter lari]EII0701138.1 hypothetical protein [Campylobacter lari]MCR2058984.1 hypothetical protein [Campylobacter lari subsp. concheus]